MRERGSNTSGPGAAAVQGSAKVPYGRMWLTLTDAARLLGVTRHGMRWLALEKVLRSERTLGGQYLFRYADVDVLVVQRAKRQARQRHPALAQIRPRMATAQLRLPLERRSAGDRSTTRSRSTPLEFPKRSRNVA